MKLAILSPNKNPYSETFIQAHKEHLDVAGYYYGRGPFFLEGKGRLNRSWYYYYQRVLQLFTRQSTTSINLKVLKRQLAKDKIQVALVEYGNHANYLLPILSELGIKLIAHFHGYDASVDEVIDKNKSYGRMFGYASKVIAVSKVMRQGLLKLGCPEDKLVYNVYGPRPQFLSMQPRFTKKQFFFLGRFTNKKAPYFLVLSFQKVLEQFPNAKLIMAGSGQLHDTCVNLVKALNLEHAISFPGVIGIEQHQQLIEESLGYVQHSLIAQNGDSEGTPLAILEASAAGLPVISTFHAGIPDVILDQETGLLCEERDFEQMAQYMSLLLKEEGMANSMGAKGKERIATHFSLDRHIKKLESIIAEVA